jgi:digeranylgeranylglycerophospholipid reductase
MSGRLACDVLVVGLGPAGASAAAAAARCGARTIAVDRRKGAGTPVQCAEFAPLPLGGETPALKLSFRQAIAGMRTYVDDESPHSAADFRGAMIDRAAFDRALCAAAAAAGAMLRFGASLTLIDEDGVATLGDGGRIRAAAIVGADGPRSRIGAAVGAVNREILETRQFSAPLLASSQSTDIYLSHEIRGGYAWLFPKGDIANVGVGVDAKARARLKPLLAALRGLLIAEGRIAPDAYGWTGGPIPVGGPLCPIAKLGTAVVALAGDAAGLVNPITGAGIPAAVVSGDLAGRAAAAALAGHEGALLDYAEELEDLFGPSLRRARRRREAMMAAFNGGGTPTPAELKRSWIAFPEYWAA